MFREIFMRNNNLKWVYFLQICCDNKNTQYNRKTKSTYGIKIAFIIIYKIKQENCMKVCQLLYHIKKYKYKLENIKAKAKKQIERTEV